MKQLLPNAIEQHSLLIKLLGTARKQKDKTELKHCIKRVCARIWGVILTVYIMCVTDPIL